MKFLKKSRYGLRALNDLVVYSANGHVSPNSIAERNDTSSKYLDRYLQDFEEPESTGCFCATGYR